MRKHAVVFLDVELDQSTDGGDIVQRVEEEPVMFERPPPPFDRPAQWGNRIHQRKGFLRVVPIRAGQTYRERHAPVAPFDPVRVRTDCYSRGA